MKKKLFLIPTDMLPIPATKGGAVQNLIEFFLQWNEKNNKYDITVLSIYDNKAETISNEYNNTCFEYVKIPFGIDKRRNHKIKFISSFAYKITKVLYVKAMNAILNRGFDAVIYENTPELLYSCKIKNCKTIVHIYNDYINASTSNIDIIEENVDLIITVSDYISNIVRKTVKNNVVTLHNAVELSRFSKEKNKNSSLYNKYNIKSDAVVILFVARLVEEKGVKELLEAYKKIDTNKNIHLVIVGDRFYSGNTIDNYYKELLEIAHSTSYPVTFTGYVPYEQLTDYYEIADIGVLPTMWDEPFSMAAIEYMASSLAVIVSNSGGFPEMVGSSGFVIDRGEFFVDNLAKKMQFLIENEDVRKEYGNKAYKKSREYSHQIYCEKLDKFITSIIE